MLKIKRINLAISIFFAITSLLLVILVASPIAAAPERTITKYPCPDGYIALSVPLQDGSNCILESPETTELKDNSIIVYTRNIVRFLSAGVGIVVVLMVIIGGIQYITSQGNPQATASAKNRITNAIIALFLFIFMSAILNFLIPGGLL